MKSRVQKRILAGLADAYTFVQSQEVNRAIATVTFDQLLKEQVERNGDSERSNESQYDPYSYDPGAEEPATAKPLRRANFLSGTDTNSPTKLDRVLAIKNSIEQLVKQVKDTPIQQIVAPDEELNFADSDLFDTNQNLVGSDASADSVGFA